MSALQLARLSPKNQVTLPRDARSLGDVPHGVAVCGMPRRALHEDPAKRFPIITIVTLVELTARETKLRDLYANDPVKRFRQLELFNEGVRQMAVDDQRRIVLPPHFVAHIAAEARDVYFACTNDTIHVWNPEHYLAWRGMPPDGSDADLDALMT